MKPLILSLLLAVMALPMMAQSKTANKPRISKIFKHCRVGCIAVQYVPAEMFPHCPWEIDGQAMTCGIVVYDTAQYSKELRRFAILEALPGKGVVLTSLEEWTARGIPGTFELLIHKKFIKETPDIDCKSLLRDLTKYNDSYVLDAQKDLTEAGVTPASLVTNIYGELLGQPIATSKQFWDCHLSESYTKYLKDNGLSWVLKRKATPPGGILGIGYTEPADVCHIIDMCVVAQEF